MRLGRLIASHKVASAIFLLFVGVLIWVSYLRFTYIDRIVESGTSYGVSIGTPKREVYDRLEMIFKTVEGGHGGLYIDFSEGYGGVALARNERASGFVDFEKNDRALKYLMESDQWDFYIENNYRDFIRLVFCDDRLCKMYRHRKYFELP